MNPLLGALRMVASRITCLGNFFFFEFLVDSASNKCVDLIFLFEKDWMEEKG